MNVPIENGGTEGTGRAGTTKEQVPYLVSELLSLGVGCEGIVGAVTTEGEGDDLALGLAVLDALSKSLAVQEKKQTRNRMKIQRKKISAFRPYPRTSTSTRKRIFRLARRLDAPLA